MAGVTPRASVRDASAEKTLGADSTTFVEVPLDVVMQYFYRAKRQSSALPLSQRLAWLEARDLEDRSDWVAKFRESSKSLGEVIKETCVARDAHWVPHAVPGAPKAEASKPTAVAAAAVQPPSQFALGKPVSGKKVAKVMRDGSKICQAFQHGQCKNPKALAPKVSTSVVSWSEENAFVVCRGMGPANVGRRFRHDGAQRERRALLLGRMRQDP